MRKVSNMVGMAVFFLSGICQAGPYPFSGSFLNFERGLSDAGWAYELDQMKAIGQDTVVILSVGQFVGSDTGTVCSSADVSGIMYSGGQLGGSVDKVGLVMSFAQARGMQVWVGSLQTSGVWNSSHLDTCNRTVAQDLYSRFPGVVFAGVYMPQEVWLNPYQSPTSEAVTGLSNLVASVHTVAPGKRVLIAPYFKKDAVTDANGTTLGVSASDAASILKMVTDTTNVDVVAPQTGVGAQAGAPPLSETGIYFAAMKAVVPASTELWADVETFQFTPGVNQDKYLPAPISNVVGQVNAVQSSVTKIVSWMFGRDMSPQATYYPVQASQLYLDYQSYYIAVTGVNKLQFTYEYCDGFLNNTCYHNEVPYENPSNAYPDYGLTKLTDGQGGGYGSTGTDWVGWLDTHDNNHAKLRLDLGGVHNVKKIRVLFRSESASGIYFPSSAVGMSEYTAFGIADTQFGFMGEASVVYTDSSDFSVGWVEFATSANTKYIDLAFYHIGWLMLAEVEVYGN